MSDFWKKDFQAEINTLELIHDAIEEGLIFKWKGSVIEDIYILVLKLEKMVNFILEEYLKLSDRSILESAIIVSENWLICPKCDEAWECNSISYDHLSWM